MTAEAALTVTVSAGTAVPTEALTKIDTAVHSAVLRSLAVVDLGPGFRVADLDPTGEKSPSKGEALAPSGPAGDVHYGIFIQVNF